MTILERLKELHSKATAGPWRIPEAFGVQFSRIEGTERVCENFGDLSLPGPRANAELITLLRNNLPALLEVVEAAMELVDDASSAGGKDCHIVDSNLIDDLWFTLAKLEADDA